MSFVRHEVWGGDGDAHKANDDGNNNKNDGSDGFDTLRMSHSIRRIWPHLYLILYKVLFLKIF